MQKHISTYLKHFDLGEQDVITCEYCLISGRIDSGGFDIHHIKGRGKGMDVIGNLVCLCRKCHTRVHDKGEISKDELLLIHRYFLMGKRIKFRK